MNFLVKIFTLFLSGLILIFSINSCNKSKTFSPPTVLFTVSPNNGSLGTVFQFDASETVDANGSNSNLKYKWDFDNDGVWDTEWQSFATQEYTYSTEGYYTVGLLVEDSYGQAGWASRNLTVGSGGSGGIGYPNAIFTINPPGGNVGSEFIFDASEVSDAETSTSELEVRWDFNGDSQWDTDWSTQKQVTHIYSTEGSYTVFMEVKDSDGHISSISKSLLVNASVSVDYALVTGGTYEMGCNGNQVGECEEDENPSHTVIIRTFKMARYETTNEEFAIFLNSVGCGEDGYLDGQKYIHINSDSCQVKYGSGEFYAESGMEQRAAIFITYFGAKAFCEWVGGRLPTEAEWEYAARGGQLSNGYLYSGANNIATVAWFSDNSSQVNHNVGGKVANELGIYDMSGNAREWCSDWFDYYYYSSSPVDNPQGPETGEYRVLRGGSFFVAATNCRVADRYWGLEEDTFYKYEVGFRVAQDVTK